MQVNKQYKVTVVSSVRFGELRMSNNVIQEKVIHVHVSRLQVVEADGVRAHHTMSLK